MKTVADLERTQDKYHVSLIPCPFFLQHLPAPTVGDRTLSTRADAVHRNQEKKEDASRVLLPRYLLLAQPSGTTRSIVLWSVTRKMKLIQVLQEGSEKRPDQQPNWRTSGIIRNALKLLLSTSSSRDWGITWWRLCCLKAPGQKQLSLWRTTVQQDYILTTGTRKVYFLIELECLTFWLFINRNVIKGCMEN